MNRGSLSDVDLESLSVVGRDWGRVRAAVESIDGTRLKRVGVATYFGVYLCIAVGGWRVLARVGRSLPGPLRPSTLPPFEVVLGLPRSFGWAIASLSVALVVVVVLATTHVVRGRPTRPRSLDDLGPSRSLPRPRIRDHLSRPTVDLEVDLSRPTVDPSLPDVDLSGPDIDLTLPDVDLSRPTVDLSVPQLDPSLPDVDLPRPAIDPSLPDDDVDVSLPRPDPGALDPRSHSRRGSAGDRGRERLGDGAGSRDASDGETGSWPDDWIPGDEL